MANFSFDPPNETFRRICVLILQPLIMTKVSGGLTISRGHHCLFFHKLHPPGWHSCPAGRRGDTTHMWHMAAQYCGQSVYYSYLTVHLQYTSRQSTRLSSNKTYVFYSSLLWDDWFHPLGEPIEPLECLRRGTKN